MGHTEFTDDEHRAQQSIDSFYLSHGKCCAGCDWWRWHTPYIGDCTKSAPVSGLERYSMLGMENISVSIPAGHIVTRRDHVCGDFVDERKPMPLG